MGKVRNGHSGRRDEVKGDARIVLPRPLRRLVRQGVGLATGRVTLPAGLGRVSFAAYCAFVVGVGVIQGGHGQAVAQAMTAAAGFAIEDVKVSGNDYTSEIDILQTLGLDGTTSLLALNIDAARKALSAMPWVEAAEVRKVYPRTIEVMLNERKAYGIWQHGSDLSLIEKDGSVISPLRDNRFAALPLFVGRDAETAAGSIDKDFSHWPAIASPIKAYVRIASRRWDVHLANGVIVKLPEDDIDAAMDRLAALEASQQLLERDIAVVDLRLADRVTIRLTPEAEERRGKAVAERLKILKKSGQNVL
ncbi:cell division protein FtsQ/DivIB [Rhizobium halophytocola]|nr:cell division protein FtsQ/DivIB [Rhizobium halophytocola]